MIIDNRTISEIAYSLWECEGCPQGHDIDFWIQAEDIVKQQTTSRSCPPHRSSGLTIFPVACASYMANKTSHPESDQTMRSQNDIIKIIAAINRPTDQ